MGHACAASPSGLGLRACLSQRNIDAMSCGAVGYPVTSFHLFICRRLSTSRHPQTSYNMDNMLESVLAPARQRPELLYLRGKSMLNVFNLGSSLISNQD